MCDAYQSVELEVEKELKFSGKKEIEKYGIEKFNQKCKTNVWSYKEEWEKVGDAEEMIRDFTGKIWNEDSNVQKEFSRDDWRHAFMDKFGLPYFDPKEYQSAP